MFKIVERPGCAKKMVDTHSRHLTFAATGAWLRCLHLARRCPRAEWGVGLGLIREMKKARDIGMKNGLRVRVIVKRHVVIVDLCVLLAAGRVVITKPRAVKEPTFPPRNERPKLSDGGLQGGERSAKDLMNGMAVLGPVDGVRVKPIEFTMNLFSELHSSNTTGARAVARGCKLMVGDHREKNDDGGDERAGYRSFNLALPQSMVALWAAFRIKKFMRCARRPAQSEHHAPPVE